MIKVICLFFLFSFSNYAISGDEKLLEFNKTLSFLNLNEWIEFVSRIKSDREIPAHFQFKKPSSFEMKVLRYYNLSNYKINLSKEGLRYLSLKEMKEANTILKNPFVVKVIKAIDYNYIQQKELYENSGTMHERLRPLVISIYNIMGHDAIVKIEHEKFISDFARKMKVRKILKNSGRINLNQKKWTKYSLNQFREFYFLDLYKRIRILSIPELREFLRLVKNKKSFLKVNQVLLAFNYSFIKSIRDEIYSKEERKKQLGY